MEVFDLRKGLMNNPQMTHEDLGAEDEDWDAAQKYRETGKLGGGQGFHSFDYPMLYDNSRDQMIIGPYGWYHLDMLHQLHPDPEHGKNLARDYLYRFRDEEFGTGGRINPRGPAAQIGYSWQPPDDRAEEIEHHVGQLFGKPALNEADAGDSDMEDWATSPASLDWSGIARDIEAQPSASMGRFSANMGIRDLTEHGEPFDPERPESDNYEGGPRYGIHDDSWPFLYHAPTKELIVGPYTWFHKDMLEHHPNPELEGDYLNEVGTPKFGWAGRIGPDGTTNWYGKPRRPAWDGATDQREPDPDVIEQYLRNHLKLPDPSDYSEDDEDWTTSHFSASQDVQEVSTGKGDPEDPTWGIRRPFIVRDSIIYMGDPGSHHPWVAKAIGSDMYYNDGSYPGFVWTQPTPDADGRWVDWHMEPPEPLKSDVEETIAEAFPQYVWTPGNDQYQGWSDEKDEEDWDSDEDEPYGVLSSAFLDTDVDDYYQQVTKKAEQYLAEGERMSDAIDVAFGMVTLPPNYPGDPGADPTPDEIAHVKSMMGKPNTPNPRQELEHVYKPGGRDSDYYRWRVPVSYYPDSGQVVTGDPGDFHGDLHLPHGGRALTGMIGIQGAQGPQGEQYTPGFTWLDNKPSPVEHKAVINAIAPHWPEAVHKFQRGEPEYEDEEDWGDLEVPLNSRFDDNDFRLGFNQAYGIDLTENE